ncbi:MAG TPA: serine protease [bacterium]|nr:serine protease [bacterium]
MRTMARLALLFFLCALPLTLHAQEPLSGDTLQKLKAATVYLELDSMGFQGSGSGFLFYKDGYTGYVVTNAHVIFDPSPELRRVNVIFNSGESNELTIENAKVLCEDRVTDLAVLEIRARGLPEPINYLAPVNIQETMPVYILGFPFGEMLSLNERNPSITISRGSVSSIRTDDHGRTIAVQIDGDLNPGNSGGPIVDQRGALIGIAAAKVATTQIGFAIPAPELATLMQGRVKGIGINEVSREPGRVILKAEIKLLDPMHQLSQVSIFIGRKDEFGPGLSISEPDSRPELAARMEEFHATIADQSADVNLILSADPEIGQDINYMFMIKYTRKDGSFIYTEPSDYQASFQAESKIPMKADLDNNIKAHKPFDGMITYTLPSTINDLTEGAGGRYLVLHLNKIRKLAVFDVNELKIVRYIPLAQDNVLFAAGATKLVVISVDNNIIQRFDLASGKKELTAKLPINGVVKNIAMGSLTDGPMLMLRARGTEPLDNTTFNFFDIVRNRIAGKDIKTYYSSYRDFVHIRASADGLTYGLWHTSGSPSGLATIFLAGGKAYVYYEHDSVGTVVPGPDGRFIYTWSGIFTPELKNIMPGLEKNRMYLPANSGNFFLGLKGPERGSKDPDFDLSFYVNGDERPLTQIKVSEKFPNANMWIKTYFTLDKRFHFVPDANLILMVPESNDKIVIQYFNIMDSLEASGLDYLFVASAPQPDAKRGEKYEYNLDVKSKRGGVTYSLDSGPEGMKISKKGMISWPVPKDYEAPGEEFIIISISDTSEQQIFHTFKIAVR